VTHALDLPAPATAVCCDVAAFATQRAAADTIPALRQQPGPFPDQPLPPSFWKHADDQTVVGLAAVFQAVEQFGLDARAFADWGALAAPRFLGRAALAVALNRFALEGAWGISPHLIPHRSLHSVSGTLSQALKIHGPNFGVGGGPHAAAEALAVAGGMASDERLPGVWVVLTGYDPELTPEDPAAAEPGEKSRGGFVVEAVALALVPPGAGRTGLRLRICAGAGTAANAPAAVAAPACLPFSMSSLLATLSPATRVPAACWRLHCGWVALEPARAGAENQP
jgi:hypothetical protein